MDDFARAARTIARECPALRVREVSRLITRVYDAALRPLHSAQVLVGHALDGGGHDNVTVAVLPFPAPPMGAGSA